MAMLVWNHACFDRVQAYREQHWQIAWFLIVRHAALRFTKLYMYTYKAGFQLAAVNQLQQLSIISCRSLRPRTILVIAYINSPTPIEGLFCGAASTWAWEISEFPHAFKRFTILVFNILKLKTCKAATAYRIMKGSDMVSRPATNQLASGVAEPS